MKCKIVLIQNICELEQFCISLDWSAGTISMAVLGSLANAKFHRAECSYRGSLEEIYVSINGDFQEPLSMTSYTCYSNVKYTCQPENKIQLKQQSHTYQQIIIISEMGHKFWYYNTCGELPQKMHF